jgi:hypothetical protein
MIQSTLTEDGNTGWIQLEDGGGVHIAVKGAWGGGTIKIEQRINNTAYQIQAVDDSLIQHINNFNRHVSFEKHDTFRLTLTGSTSPTLNYSISGKLGQVT